MKFVIARYYFNSLFRDESNRTFIQTLKKEPFIEDESSMYALGNFQFENIGSYNFLRGTFGKIVKSEYSRVYNKEKQQFLEVEENDKVKAEIEFLIYHDQHIIFIEQSKGVTQGTFREKFKEIFERNSEQPESFEMDFISDRKDIYKVLKSWDKVISASFKKLRPSNPDPSDTYQNIENLIKESNADSANMSFKTVAKKDEQKSIDPDSMIVKEAIALSSAGYGEAKLVGMKGEECVSVETTVTVKMINVDFSEEGAMQNFIKAIEELKNHGKK